MFWVYIVQNPQGRFYVGQTDDLIARVFSHNRTDKTLGKFTRKNGPWTLAWSGEHPTRCSAVAREGAIKAMKSSRWIREHLLQPQAPVRTQGADLLAGGTEESDAPYP